MQAQGGRTNGQVFILRSQFYYLIAMLVVMLLNALLFPSILQEEVTEVPYSQFLTMIDDGKVRGGPGGEFQPGHL